MTPDTARLRDPERLVTELIALGTLDDGAPYYGPDAAFYALRTAAEILNNFADTWVLQAYHRLAYVASMHIKELLNADTAYEGILNDTGYDELVIDCIRGIENLEIMRHEAQAEEVVR